MPINIKYTVPKLKVKEGQSSYRQIMKATSIFGGVQVFQIIIQVIRSKFIAVLLGTTGMGIAGLLNSTISLIAILTNFGLRTSAVKSIAIAKEAENEERVSTISIVLNRLVWITGILGALVTLVLSSWLSQITFGNHNYTIAFIWISITLLFTQISNGQKAILQGLKKIKYLAYANLYGSIIGLFITLPLYYKLGIDGIVPGIIITSIITMTISSVFKSKIKLKYIKVSRIRTIAESKNMLSLGLVLSLSGIITTITSYVIRIFIGQIGGVEEVGLYTAGIAIIATYFGLVFNAMSTDYLPRLSAVVQKKDLFTQTINHQAEIAILILSPILLVFMVYIKWAVILLYSSKFIAITGMIQWAVIGIYFKALSWCLSYSVIVKGKPKIFFINELFSNIYILLLNILFYYYLGFDGLGISFLIGYILYFIQFLIVVKRNFSFSFNLEIKKIFSIQFSLGVVCFLIIKYGSNPINYLIGSILIIISLIISFYELNKRLGLIGIIKNKK